MILPQILWCPDCGKRGVRMDGKYLPEPNRIGIRIYCGATLEGNRKCRREGPRHYHNSLEEAARMAINDWNALDRLRKSERSASA